MRELKDKIMGNQDAQRSMFQEDLEKGRDGKVGNQTLITANESIAEQEKMRIRQEE